MIIYCKYINVIPANAGGLLAVHLRGVVDMERVLDELCEAYGLEEVERYVDEIKRSRLPEAKDPTLLR